MTSFDVETIQSVVNDSMSGLEIASSEPFATWLPFTPTRIRILIISLSVFLLRAAVILGQDYDASSAVEVLNRCQEAVQAHCLDDIDFASRYAALIQKYTRHLEEGLRSHTASSDHGPASQAIDMLRNGFSWPPPTHHASQAAVNEPPARWASNGMSGGQGVAETPLINAQQSEWAPDPSFDFLDLGWDNVTFDFQADSLDFLWASNEQDILEVGGSVGQHLE